MLRASVREGCFLRVKTRRPGIYNYNQLSWWVLGWQAWGILLGQVADKPRIGSPHVGR